MTDKLIEDHAAEIARLKHEVASLQARLHESFAAIADLVNEITEMKKGLPKPTGGPGGGGRVIGILANGGVAGLPSITGPAISPGGAGGGVGGGRGGGTY